jgi:hypothetical protein
MEFKEAIQIIMVVFKICINQYLIKDNNHYIIIISMVKKINNKKRNYKELIHKNIKERLFHQLKIKFKKTFMLKQK